MKDYNELCEELKNNLSILKGVYYVYIHINKINNKKYVGITCQETVEDRWKNGKAYGRSPHFNAAIEKYGWDNFEHITLFDYIDEKSAFEIEKTLIKELKLQDPNYGYNIADGGDINPMQGKHHTEEARQKMSQALLDRYAEHPESHPWLGRNHTEETKEKMMYSSKKRQEILCVETGIIYPSIREATRQMELKSKNSITLALNDPNRTAKGYHWKRIEKENN